MHGAVVMVMRVMLVEMRPDVDGEGGGDDDAIRLRVGTGTKG